MLIWLEGAPQFQVDSDVQLPAYIDKIITCHKQPSELELLNLVNRQVHRHSHTCRENTKTQCRFNYPQPPMKHTMILYPLDKDVADNEFKMHKGNWQTIKGYLDNMKEGEDISFDQLLINMSMTEEKYLLPIRSSTPIVFLKRNPNELRINNYNPACLSA